MKHKLGITLIEILVAIIVTVALILTFYSLPPSNQMRTSQTNANMFLISSFLRTYYAENQRWPNQEKWTEELKESDFLFIDFWKNPIQCRIIGENGIQTVLLYSYGKNKTDDNGTGDDITRKIEPPTPEEIESYKKNQ